MTGTLGQAARNKDWSLRLLPVVAFVLLFVIFNRFSWKENSVFQYDQGGYYRYLPAVFIYHDLGYYGFLPEINGKYNVSAGVDFYAAYPQEKTGRRLNKYSLGVSLFELPWFLAAHALTKATHHYPADGYSPYYRLFISIGQVCWVLLGLWLLSRLLRRYYSEWTAALTMLLILFGTNLYNYTVWDIGMSHPYSFTLFAAFLNLTGKWYRQPRRWYALLLGLLYGLIVITRPVNALLIMTFLFWTGPDTPLRGRLKLMKREGISLLLAALVCAAVLFVQMAYWKYATGHFIYYSYEGEGFDFLRPQIWNGLFSFRKGWLVYTPLVLLCIAGLVPLYRRSPGRTWLIACYLAIAVYIAFSWRMWYYGGSFGCRVMIESLALLSLPLAALTEWMGRAERWKRNALIAGIAFCVSLNLWQSYQFSLGLLPTDGTTESVYRKMFFRLERPSAQDSLQYGWKQ